MCVCILNLGDLGCWGWVGAGASFSCCLYVCVVLGLSFVLWCKSAFLSWIVLVLAAPPLFLVLCWLLLVVCVFVSLSSCCLGGCACGLFVSSVSVCLLACLSSFVVVLMCVSAF